MVSWKRPKGPISVYNIVSGYERAADGTKKEVKISIQEIPNEKSRWKEILDLVSDHYIKNEPLSNYLNMKDDRDSIDDYELYWEYALEQGISVAAYVLDESGQISKLVGVNLLHYINSDTKKDFAEKIKPSIKSPKFYKIYKLMEVMFRDADVHKIYNVDKYLGSISLSVHPDFQGQRLGYYLLKARNDVGLKYGLTVTSTIFTAIQSQKQAAHAGFEEILVRKYADMFEEDGRPTFPNIEDLTGATTAKVMMKSLL